jgi:predicted Na+-dependent transporter
MEELPAYVKILAYLFVVVYMLSVPLETPRGEIVATLRDFRLMGYALLANLIIIPVLSVILARVLALPLEMRTGFLMLALAPGGLFALQFARVSQGNRVLAVGLLVVLTLVAIVVTPVLMSLFFPPSEAGKMPFAWLMLLLLLLVAAPLLVGRAFQQRAPATAPKLGRLLGVLSIVIFIIAALAAGKYKMPEIKSIGTDGIVAIIALTLCAWAVGWLLGGPEISNRKVLAISTSMRNVGVCFLIAAHYFPGTDVVVPILAFSGISIPMNMLFALITGRMRRDTEVSTRPVEA